MHIILSLFTRAGSENIWNARVLVCVCGRVRNNIIIIAYCCRSLHVGPCSTLRAAAGRLL